MTDQRTAEVTLKVNSEQARKEFDELQTKATRLRKEFAEAFKRGDSRAITDINKELNKVNKEIDRCRTNAANIHSAMLRLNEASPKDLRRTIAQINSELNSGRVVRGSREWDSYIEKLKLVNAELRKVQAEQKATAGFFSRLAGTFTKWWGTYTILNDAIGQANMKLSKMKQDFREKESAQANLKALTGLDDSSIDWLTRQAERLSTTMDETGLRITQSSKEILEAYMLVGSNKPELLTDKQALNDVTVEAMRLASAANMKLQPAVDAMTTALNQFGEGADKAGEFVNVLAAGSKFGAANVEQQAASILKSGTAAASANVKFEELVGSIEMLGEKGIKGEIAGTGLKKFFLVLQTGAKETNPKVVGLSSALASLKAQVDAAEKKKVGGGASFLKKMFGEEAYSIAAILTDNTEKVREYTSAVTGTETALEQAATNSETTAAKLDQMRNKMRETGILLVEKLNPSLGILVSWNTKLISALPGLIDWLIKNRSIVLALVAAFVAYKAVLIAHTAATKAYTAVVATATAAKKIWRASVIAARLAVIALTQGLDKARRAMRLMNITLAATPWGAVAAAVAVLTGVLVGLISKYGSVAKGEKMLSDIRKNAEKNMVSQVNKINLLISAAQNENLTLEQRKKAVDKLNAIIPGYNAQIDETTGKYRASTTALNNYIDALRRKYEIEGAKEQLAELGKQRAEIMPKLNQAQKGLEDALAAPVTYSQPTISTGNTGFMPAPVNTRTVTIESWQRTIEEYNDKLEDIKKQEDIILDAYRAELESDAIESTDPETPDPPGGTPDVPGSEKEAQAALKKALEEEKKLKLNAEAENTLLYSAGLRSYTQYCQEKEKIEGDSLERQKTIHEDHNKIDLQGYLQVLAARAARKKAADDKEVKESLEKIEKEHKLAQDAAVKEFYDSESSAFQNQRILNQKLLVADIEYLQKKARLYEEGSKERAEIEKQIEERQAKDKLDKQKELAEAIKFFRDNFEKGSMEEQCARELAMLETLHKAKLISEQQYLEASRKLRQKYDEQSMSDAEKSVNKVLDIMKPFVGEEAFGSISKSISEYLRNLSEEELTKLLTALDNMFANPFGKMALDIANTFKNLWASINKDSVDWGQVLADNIVNIAQTTAAVIGGVLSTFSNLWNAERELEIQKIEKGYDREIEAAGKNEKKKKKLEEEKQAEIAKVKNKYNDRAMKLEVAQAIAQTAANALGAFGAMVKIPVVGPALAAAAAAMATAAGMIQIATIKKQHQAQAAGYYSGGFTSRGPDNRREVGVVHANEFVANHQAVANPALSPVLRLIDVAQRNNTVGSLTRADVSKALRPELGVGAGGGPNVVAPVDDSLAAPVALLAEMTADTRAALMRLVETLDNGIEASVAMDGENGLYRSLKRFDRLKTNAKR